jgi:hypothetical protein
VFCSFLALFLRKRLEDQLAAARLKCEWGALLIDLDRLQEIETRFVLRTPVTGDVGPAFQAVGIALPPNIREAPASPGDGLGRGSVCGAKSLAPAAKALKILRLSMMVLKLGQNDSGRNSPERCRGVIDGKYLHTPTGCQV